jgi:arylformamidase
MPGKIYDISVDIRQGMPVFPGDPRFRLRQLHDAAASGFNLHKIMMGNHTGTHVDAPAHFIPGGATVTDLSLELMNGNTRVVEFHGKEKIDASDLKKILVVDDFRVLFKTRNSLLWGSRKKFKKDHIYLTPDAANFLVESGIKLVGFDYLSVDRFGDESYPVHKILLQNGVILIESLNLAEVEQGDYDMSCLPLKLSGLDAAPARVILRG